MLFAQAPAPGGGPPANMWAIIGAVCAFYVLFLAVLFLIWWFFLRTLSRALRRCHPDTRLMEPGLVWLNFIPCFNYVWFIVTVIQLSSSLRTEFDERQLGDGETDYGRTLGLTLGILTLVGTVVPYIPVLIDPQLQLVGTGLSLLLGGVQLVLFIVYWVRVAGYGRELADDDEAHHRADDEDDTDRDTPDAPPPEEPTDAPRD